MKARQNDMTSGSPMKIILWFTLPIFIAYPFVQKHFVKGTILGSVKG